MNQTANEYTPIEDYLEEFSELSDRWLQGLQDHATQGD